MSINGKTKVTGIFGYPVEHSLSPSMHNAAFGHLGLNYCYVPFSVRPEQLSNAIESIRVLNLRGVNITVPHKENAIPFLDHVDEEASFIGAVNTVVNSDGILTGHNTDGRGFMESLKESRLSLDGIHVLILGAGGASRAISYYLSELVGHLSIYDLNRERASLLVNDLQALRTNISVTDNVRHLDSFSLIVNATPLGLKDDDPPPIDISLLTDNMTVCDLIYHKTPLLKGASNRGCKTLDGLGMLLHQGAHAFRLWTGKTAPIDVMRAAISGHF